MSYPGFLVRIGPANLLICTIPLCRGASKTCICGACQARNVSGYLSRKLAVLVDSPLYDVKLLGSALIVRKTLTPPALLDCLNCPRDATARRPLCLRIFHVGLHNEDSVRASRPRHGGINSSSQGSLEEAHTKTDPKAVGIPTKVLSVKK